MSSTLEEPVGLNPFASPLVSAQVIEKNNPTTQRASLRKLRHVNRLWITADVFYVANWCFFLGAFLFLRGEIREFAWIGCYITFLVFWYATVAGYFRASGANAGTMLTPFLLLVPWVGVLVFLAAKQEMRVFMTVNGYRPRFFGFSADKPQRLAMEQDPDYTPSLRTHFDGSKRRHVYSLAECWLGLICLSALSFVLLAWMRMKFNF